MWAMMLFACLMIVSLVSGPLCFYAAAKTLWMVNDSLLSMMKAESAFYFTQTLLSCQHAGRIIWFSRNTMQIVHLRYAK